MQLENDLKQLAQKGLSIEDIEFQLSLFRNGIPPVRLHRPASPGDGVIVLLQNEVVNMANFYRENASSLHIQKFVPASGAATRMFSEPITWYNKLSDGMSAGILLKEYSNARKFFAELKSFAFYDELKSTMLANGVDISQTLTGSDYHTVLECLLFDSGLGYANKPKGLIPFHRYATGARTPLEEQMVEGAYYARRDDGTVSMHFTVSPEHLAAFEKLLKLKTPQLEADLDVKYSISLSVQDPSTDTVAVDLNNELFREKDETLVFRPGGHGALIENLNSLDCDLVFIKNIDNVVPDHHKHETYLYKLATAGMLLKLQEEVFYWLRLLTQHDYNEDIYQKASDFAQKQLNMDPYYIKSAGKESWQQLIDFLNRPLRVCGMVKNQGEPGGGPFWIKDANTGKVSLQIIESSQIDLNDPAQKAIFSVSTHFNPVDLVCSLKDFNGSKFDLKSYVDAHSGFISQKTKDGKVLKALELPGLWNGAMASWITLFVEVPLITFNPVKSVNDLLRPEHR